MIFELAGFLGLDPRPWSLRELATMARGRAARQWDHTASLLAMTANVHRDVKKNRRGFHPSAFHPFMRRRRRGTTPAALRSLKGLFGKKN